MRKTTICRSDVARLVALTVVLAGAGRLEAQKPAPAAAPVPQGQQVAAPPGTHTVQRGETLWGLARQFLGDPLLWAEIYRLNIDVVEDPHWIYPGEELRFGASDQQAGARPAGADTSAAGNIAVVPAQDSVRGERPAPERAPVAESRTIFSSRLAPSQDMASIELREERAYRAVRPGEYYSSGFITDRHSLPTGTLVGPVEQAAIRRLTTRNSAGLYATVVVTPPPGGVYTRGDMLLVYRVDQVLPGYGDLIRPLGLLQVLTDATAAQNGTARVTALYASLSVGDLLTKTVPFRSNSSARAQPVDSGVVGHVIATRSGRELTSTQDVLYVDRGADDGVRLGDVFRISSAPGADRVRVQAEALVVHTDPKTASLLVIQVTQPDIRAGATARQVRRMPS